MNAQIFFTQLWQDYLTMNPQAAAIHNALTKRGETIINDHVAFRTFNNSPIQIKTLEPFLLAMGYQAFEPYHFAAKKIDAIGYIPNEKGLPRIFLSELRVDELSTHAQSIVNQLIDQIDPTTVNEASVFWRGRLWPAPSVEDYQFLSAESEYAAWLCLMGLRANHFTISINQLNSITDIAQMNQFIKQLGFELNTSGGEIKGSPADLLVQSSTLAARQSMTLSNNECLEVPTCYYEFAQRFKDAHGELYQGFVAANADKIFESTHTQKTL